MVRIRAIVHVSPPQNDQAYLDDVSGQDTDVVGAVLVILTVGYMDS